MRPQTDAAFAAVSSLRPATCPVRSSMVARLLAWCSSGVRPLKAPNSPAISASTPSSDGWLGEVSPEGLRPSVVSGVPPGTSPSATSSPMESPTSEPSVSSPPISGSPSPSGVPPSASTPAVPPGSEASVPPSPVSSTAVSSVRAFSSSASGSAVVSAPPSDAPASSVRSIVRMKSLKSPSFQSSDRSRNSSSETVSIWSLELRQSRPLRDRSFWMLRCHS